MNEIGEFKTTTEIRQPDVSNSDIKISPPDSITVENASEIYQKICDKSFEASDRRLDYEKVNDIDKQVIDDPNSMTVEKAEQLFENLVDHFEENQENEVNHKQKESIVQAFERILQKEELTSAEKGNLGEILMDQYYMDLGYTPIHNPRVTDLSHKSGQGIDGVYEKTNPDGTKVYVIGEAKVNTSQLNTKLADGTKQMDSKWINDRLDDAVGKEKADEIRDAYEDDPDSVRKEVYHFDYEDISIHNAQADVCTVDDDGNKNDDLKIVQTFNSEGQVIFKERGDENDEG